MSILHTVLPSLSILKIDCSSSVLICLNVSFSPCLSPVAKRACMLRGCTGIAVGAVGAVGAVAAAYLDGWQEFGRRL